jgi:hypothetical protein
MLAADTDRAPTAAAAAAAAAGPPFAASAPPSARALKPATAADAASGVRLLARIALDELCRRSAAARDSIDELTSPLPIPTVLAGPPRRRRFTMRHRLSMMPESPAPQKDASSVNAPVIPSSLHATTRPVPRFDFCTTKRESANEKRPYEPSGSLRSHCFDLHMHTAR